MSLESSSGCVSDSSLSSTESADVPTSVLGAVAFAELCAPGVYEGAVHGDRAQEYSPTSPAPEEFSAEGECAHEHEDALLPADAEQPASVDKEDAEAVPPRIPLRRHLLQHSPAEKCRARGAASGRRPLPPAGRGHVGGGKKRRLEVGDAAEDDNEDGEAADIPPISSSEDDKPMSDLRALHPFGRRQLRPVRDCVAYGRRDGFGMPLQKRTRRVHLGRQPRNRRVCCPQVLLTISAKALIIIFETLGFIPSRPPCGKCGLLVEPRETNIRIRTRTNTFQGPGDFGVSVSFERAAWMCQKGCSWEPSVLNGSLLVPGYSLRQNAQMLWHWARMQEGGLEELAEIMFVDHPKLLDNVKTLRKAIAEYQEEENTNIQLGGVGVEVEIDEVCLRARWVTVNGVPHREWVR